jgi:hypothetical protein
MSASTQAPIIPIKSSSEPPHVIAPDAATIFSRRAAALRTAGQGPQPRRLAALPRRHQPRPARGAASPCRRWTCRTPRKSPLPASTACRPAAGAVLAAPRSPGAMTASPLSPPPSPHAPDAARKDLARLAALDAERSKPWPSACCTPSSMARMPPCCPMSAPRCRCYGPPAPPALASAKSPRSMCPASAPAAASCRSRA